MTELSLKDAAPQRVETPCLVAAARQDAGPEHGLADIDAASGGMIAEMLASGDIATGAGKTTLLHRVPGIRAERLLVVGLGKKDKLDRVTFENACLAAGAALRAHRRIDAAHVIVHEHAVEDLDAHWRLRHAALAFERANYLYTATKPLKDDSPRPVRSLSFTPAGAGQAALDQAAALAAGYRTARELGNLPPNICNPAYLAQQARLLAGKLDNASVEVLDRAEMAELGMDALLGVAQGSENDPKLIVLKYEGGEANEKPVVLVGKGITFDTGGISLKPGPDMDQMKYDMCGAASVIGAFEACARMGLKLNLVSIVAAVENMPDGKAYRPGDVLTSMSGQTIEVLNTDAEGRLILCDSLTYAERFEPAAIVDVATLTGAAVIALGHHATAVMSKHDALADELLAAGHAAVDRGWRLPLWDDYQQQLDSPFADMKNVGGQPAGTITAGCFLSRFAKGQTWAHLDIAGSAWKWGGKDGATGRPVGMLTHFLMGRA